MFGRIFKALPFPYGPLIGAQSGENSYMVSTGWALSRQRREPVDAEGRPVPWYTYPAIRFLEARVQPHFRVFEFGAGNSTRWWAERVASVRAVEHDSGWVARLKPQLNGIAQLDHCPLESEKYPVPEGGPYHVIVIDGRRRTECAKSSIGALTEDGVIIWDNSERERYSEGRALLNQAGFSHLDFWGVVPGGIKEISTTVFYREGNCLGI